MMAARQYMLLLALALPGACTASYPDTPTTITVRDARTLEPIPDAVIAAQPLDRRIVPLNPLTASGAADYMLRPRVDPSHPVRTDETGGASISLRSGLAATLTVMAPGYVPTSFPLDDPFDPMVLGQWLSGIPALNDDEGATAHSIQPIAPRAIQIRLKTTASPAELPAGTADHPP